MDTDARAELLTLRALLLLTLGELANMRRDPDRFLSEIREELVRAVADVRVEPETYQVEVRLRAVAFAQDWLGHIHFKDEGAPNPHGPTPLIFIRPVDDLGALRIVRVEVVRPPEVVCG